MPWRPFHLAEARRVLGGVGAEVRALSGEHRGPHAAERELWSLHGALSTDAELLVDDDRSSALVARAEGL